MRGDRQPFYRQHATPWLLAALVSGFAAWRIVSLGMADHRAVGTEATDADAALGWRADHPVALAEAARARLDAEPQAARPLLVRALAANPAHGLSYAMLAVLDARAGDTETARKAMAEAVRLAPARPQVRLVAAAAALADNALDEALVHWNAALSRRGSMRAALFPDLLRLAEAPGNRAAFAAMLGEPAPWWPAFMGFAADRAESLESVMALYTLTRESAANPLAPDALAAVLRRLKRERRWTEARLVWLDNLPVEQLDGMNNVFNGDFEHPLTDRGFDWLRASNEHVAVAQAATAGAGGTQALQVVFRGPRTQFRHLTQHLMLPPGSYRLRGRVRSDELDATNGAVWTVSCVGTRYRRIATSEHFRGHFAWRSFETAVSVPAEDCPAQALRLELDGRVALDFEARGTLWFDDIAMDRILAP